MCKNQTYKNWMTVTYIQNLFEIIYLWYILRLNPFLTWPNLCTMSLGSMNHKFLHCVYETLRHEYGMLTGLLPFWLYLFTDPHGWSLWGFSEGSHPPSSLTSILIDHLPHTPLITPILPLPYLLIPLSVSRSSWEKYCMHSQNRFNFR